MHEAKETQISAAYGANGTNFNIVVSPTDNFAVSVSRNYGKVSNESFSDPKGYTDMNTHSYTEGAVGYYDHFNGNFIFEAYAGLGRGEGKDQYYRDEGPWFGAPIIREYLSSGKFEKYFVQANIGTRDEHVATGFALRISKVNFLQLTKMKEGISEDISKKQALFFEPAFYGRFGSGMINAEIEIVLPYTQNDIDFDYRTFIISVGLRFIF